MAQSDDNRKLTPEEQQAAEQYVREHPGSTLLKDERTAKYIERQRMRERGETPVQWREIEARAKNEKKWKFGRADWTPPDLTKPLPKQPSADLWNALGEFVNLPDSTLENFRSRYPSFFPAWFYSIPAGNDAEPGRGTGLLGWQVWRKLLREAWHASFHPEYTAQLLNIPTVPPGNTRFEIAPVCDAQRAVMAITLESWRARFCPRCGRPFVARKSADKYWPKKCFVEQRREKQRASKRNRRRRRGKSSRKGRER